MTILAATGLAREAALIAGPGVTVVVSGGRADLLEQRLLAAADGATAVVSLGIAGALAPSLQPGDWVVLELSSFQLEDLACLEPNPHVAVVTNFTPNHLDRHKSVEAYRAAKQNILRWQTADRIAVINQSDPDVMGWRTDARRVFFGREDEGRQGVFGIGFDSYKRRVLFRFFSLLFVLEIKAFLYVVNHGCLQPRVFAKQPVGELHFVHIHIA